MHTVTVMQESTAVTFATRINLSIFPGGANDAYQNHWDEWGNFVIYRKTLESK